MCFHFNPTLLAGTPTVLLLSSSHAPKFRWLAEEYWNEWISYSIAYP